LDLLSSLGNKLYLSINPEVLNKKGEGGSRARLKELGDRRCHECFQKDKKRVNAIVRKWCILIRKLWKYWSFVLAFILLAALTATFAISAAPRNPL